MSNVVRYYPVDDEAANWIASLAENKVFAKEDEIPKRPESFRDPSNPWLYISPNPFEAMLDGNRDLFVEALNSDPVPGAQGIALMGRPIDDIGDDNELEILVHSVWLNFKMRIARSLLRQEARRPNTFVKWWNATRTKLESWMQAK